MLSECVDKQILELQTIRKTQDIMVFDSVLITANLWTRIANISLITMNDSQICVRFVHFLHNEIISNVICTTTPCIQ